MGIFSHAFLQSLLPLRPHLIHLAEAKKVETHHAVSMLFRRLRRYRLIQTLLATTHRSAPLPQYLPTSLRGILALHLHCLRNSRFRTILRISQQHQFSPLRPPQMVPVIASVPRPNIMQIGCYLPWPPGQRVQTPCLRSMLLMRCRSLLPKLLHLLPRPRTAIPQPDRQPLEEQPRQVALE